MDIRLTAKSIATGCGRLAYHTAPSRRQAPTVVLLHGLSANHTTWQPTLEALSRAGYACLAPDLRGHGDSDKRKVKRCYELGRFSQDLEAILEQENITRPLLVGYSFGGSIALDYARRFPGNVAGLILVSANHNNPFRYWGLEPLTLLGRGLLNSLAWLCLWQGRRRYRYYRPEEAASYWRSVWQGFGTMPWSVNFWLIEQLLRLDFQPQPGLNAPAWIVYSQNDPFFTEAERADLKLALPQAELLPSNHPNHFIASENQAAMASLLLSILASYENSHL